MLCPLGRCLEHCTCSPGVVDGHGEPDDDGEDTDLLPPEPIIIESAD